MGGMRSIGKGMSADEEFSDVMNMSRPPKFNKYEAILIVVPEKVCQESMDNAKEEAKYCRCPQKMSNVHSDNCYVNYSGTSGGMEAEGIRAGYECSKSRNVQYVYYLSDEDSSTYKSVADL
ncbi:hypothetical protein HHI36_008435 [Cryptolaemus montrouzieri]|uniref:Mutator-like transposase domain-containing protein n=1 Tax=Cryptolaemus montrouzieri TaxID=559131 RepID=A0ABD2MSP0_9CUCU